MTAWPDLLAAALVGTDRRPLGTDDDAATLLDEAAAWSVYRRAGTRPATGLRPPAAAPAESAELVGAAAAGRLATLVDPGAGEPALLSEWLSVAAQRGLRVPPELLPELLDRGRRSRDLRPLILAAGGARVGWLAGQNPEWTYILAHRRPSGGDHDATQWHEGSRGQRVSYLATARERDPAGARQLLASEWERLASDERAELLPVLATGLSPDDEGFLEHVLDDRRAPVRAGAAELLARLPGCALNARMAQRARGCLTVRDDRIAVAAPATCDAGMRRDGLEVKPPAATGERAWWLEQLLARTPLSVWPEPSAFLSHRIEDGWAPTVLRGLALAAATQRDPAWAATLLDLLGAQPAASQPAGSQSARPPAGPQPVGSPRSRGAVSPVAALYPALERGQILARAIAALRADPPERLLVHILEHCPAPWPDELARAALAGFEAHARRRRTPYDLVRAVRIAALRMPATCAAGAAQAAQRFAADRPGDDRVHVFDRLATILQVRHDMLEELT